MTKGRSGPAGGAARARIPVGGAPGRARRKAAATAVPLLAVVLALAACSSNANTSGQGSHYTLPKTALVDAAKVSCAQPSSCITVGTIATVSVVKDLFLGAFVGVDAYMSYIDSTDGGVDNKRIKVIEDDDGLSASTNRADTEALINQGVMGLVGSFSLVDQSGATVLEQHPDVPDVSVTLSQQVNALPNVFSIDPIGLGWGLGALTWFKEQYPQAIKHTAVLVAQEPSAQTQAAGLEGAMRHLGYDVVYAPQFGPLQSQFQDYILRMRDLGVQFVDLSIMDADVAEHIVQQMHEEGFHPQVVESAGPIYVGDFAQQAGGNQAADGIYLAQNDALYLDGSQGPAVSTFLGWVQKVDPGFTPDLFTLYGWESAELFVEGLLKAGKHPTPAKVTAALKTITSFDGGGLEPTVDPPAHIGARCWLLARIENGKFVKIPPSPKMGFICNPGGYYG